MFGAMEPENLRENWELLGDVFYETTEVYEMEWVDKVRCILVETLPVFYTGFINCFCLCYNTVRQ